MLIFDAESGPRSACKKLSVPSRLDAGANCFPGPSAKWASIRFGASLTKAALLDGEPIRAIEPM